jgi:uncharacterized delta-60 repeat protein
MGFAEQPTDHPVNPLANVSLSGPVGSILVQSDGKFIIAGGGSMFFATDGSRALGYLNGTLARFKPDGSLDYSFSCRSEPPSYSSVFDAHVAERQDGRLLLSGSFHNVNGRPQSWLALLMPDGSLDKQFIPWRNITNGIQARPFAPPQFYLAAFDTNGQLAVPALKPNPSTAELRVWRMDNSGALAGTLQSDVPMSKNLPSLLTTLTERGFGLFRPIDWQRNEPQDRQLRPPNSSTFVYAYLTAAFMISGSDASEILRAIFGEVPLELCRNAVRLPDGGAILLVQEGDDGRFMRFDKDWRANLSYTNTLRARGYLSLALQPDRKLLVARGSDLRDIASGSLSGVVRCNANGWIDRSFHCETDERVMCVAAQKDGKILIGGFFSKVNGFAAPWLARLNSDGSVDQEFQRHFGAGASANVRQSLLVQSVATGRTAAPPAASDTNLGSGETIFITGLTVQDGVAQIQFQASPNHIYTLQARNNLKTGDWFNVTTTQSAGNGFGVLHDPGAKDASVRFYQVVSP